MEPSGLPTGVLGLAEAYAARALALLPAESAALLPPAPRLAAAAVLMPVALAAREGIPVPPRPNPLTVGAGAVAADLAGAADHELFERLLGSLEPGERQDPELVAARAQELRLPVLPYRTVATAERPRAQEPRFERVPEAPPADAATRAERSPARLKVIDLSSMWAAPLTTALLARLGAEVLKIEMPSRPDGLRRWGRPAQKAGADSPFYAALNGGKRLLALDLRERRDRRRFEQHVAGADLLVESYSSRVMPNLGYPLERLRKLRPSLLVARLRAFPPGPWTGWTAYGAGIHACAGLGDTEAGFTGAALSYPDPLAGLLLFAGCLELLARRASDAAVAAVEVSLLGAVAPLIGNSRPSGLAAEVDAEEALALGAGELG